MSLNGPEIVDITEFLKDKNSQKSIEECKRLATTLKNTSCVIIKDPRVSEDDNNTFLSMMEKYYSQPLEQKMRDVHPELSYQLGATPEFIEVPRDHTEVIKKLTSENAAHIPKGADPKWRYFWRIGERPLSTKFPELNAPEVIPQNFPHWKEVMNKWGNLMLQSITTVAEMTAIGLDLPFNTFVDYLKFGPHLLAPTGSDLSRFNKIGQIFAGFHYDLNFLTIHGKSRFPGLFIWLRDGTKTPVKVPDGCLLIQAGKQIEWLTGGAITAGYHEVVVVPETLQAVERAKKEQRSLWRVSSTLFSHVNSDKELKPVVPSFSNPENLKNYPPTLAGIQVQEELNLIKLGVGGQPK
jgi:isopenicillin N synthase-like dioxygenase